MNLKDQKGQGLTEYAVILSLVAVASIAAMAFFGGAVKGKMAALSGAVSGQKLEEVTEANNKSQSAATEATKRASKVKGTTSIGEDSIFDNQDL